MRDALPDAASNPSPPPPKPRRWTILAAGFLLLALALIVIYTSRAAFYSPLALMVVAAIGLAALLLQIRFGKGIPGRVHAPLGLNILGLIFAFTALLADFFHLRATLMQITALGAVLCFAVSSGLVLHALRRTN